MQSRLFFAAVLGVAVAVAAPSMHSQQHPGHPAPHWPKPTNLQVLPKNTTPQQLHKIMHDIAGSLGVHCTFCHVMNQQTHHIDFASDAKPTKNIARLMMRMTWNINQQYLSKVHNPEATPQQQHVGCGTCHRGQKMPPEFVPPPEHHGPMHGPMPGM